MNILIYTSPLDENFVRIGRCGGSSKIGEKWPPIKLMYLAGIARKHASIAFIDGDAENMPQKEFFSRLKELQPDIAITEPTPGSLEKEIGIIQKMKHILPDLKIIFIGALASASQEKLLKKYKEIDFIISGEAEKPLEELLKGRNKRKIKSLSFRVKKKIIINKKTNLFSNLDDLPFPAHDLLRLDKYEDITVKRKPFTFIETSRGCPFSCIYCNAWMTSGKRTRFRSPESIIKELELIKKLGIKEVKVNDETFTLNHKRLVRILNLIKKRRLNILWDCNSRVDTVNPKLLELMKSAGCNTIFFGVESGNQKILDYYKRNIKIKTIKSAFLACRKLGIRTGAHFIFGAPFESKKTIKESIDLAMELKADYAAFNLLTPYSGTELYKDLLKRKLICNEDLSVFDQSKSSVIRSYHLTTAQLNNHMRKAYKRYYYRPSYILRRIINLHSPDEIIKLTKSALGLLNLTNKKHD